MSAGNDDGRVLSVVSPLADHSRKPGSSSILPASIRSDFPDSESLTTPSVTNEAPGVLRQTFSGTKRKSYHCSTGSGA